jgi:hypothetical protein
MANQNMTNIALVDGTPPQSANTFAGGTSEIVAVDTMEVTALSTDDTVVLFRIPVDAKITELALGCDDLASTSITIDLGLYEGGTAGATAVDDDCFATAVNVDGGVAITDYRFEAAAIDTIDQPAWEVAGLSARPAYGDFDVVLHADGVSGGTTGTVSARIRYVI